MNLMKLLASVRANLSPLLILVLLLFYIASGFSVKGFGYAVVLMSASLLFIACGVVLYTDRRGGAFKVLQFGYWLILFSLVCYFIQIDFFWSKLAGETQKSFFERLRQILQIIYFSGFSLSFAALFISSVIRAEAKEALGAVLTMGGLLLVLVALNYWSHIRPAAVDMTLMRKFTLSQDSRDLLRGVSNEVKITVFYPDEIFKNINRDTELMLRDAVSVNGKISYAFVDPMIEIALAEQKGVKTNGTILIEATDADEPDPKMKLKTTRFEIPDEEALKRFERELISNIMQVSGKKRNIYYTQGHDEKRVSSPFKDDSIEAFDENLRALRHQMKQLSASEGFPVKMPQADLVLALGPMRDFSQTEKAALKKYFDDGGKLLIAVDPESAADFSFLLSPFKVKFIKTKVHSDKAIQPGKTTIQSANYSEHAITAPFVRRPEENKLTVFPGVGYLETGNEPSPDYDVNYFLLSHFTSWIDKVANGVRDDKQEPAASFKIGMAVKSKKNAGRLIFVGDSDFLINKFLTSSNQNLELAMRMIGWLTEDEKLSGIVAGKYDDEKVRLTGTKDTIVFHLFLYIFPGIILLTGFFVVRAKRRRMSDRAGDS